jgi:hypothetical protein
MRLSDPRTSLSMRVGNVCARLFGLGLGLFIGSQIDADAEGHHLTTADDEKERVGQPRKIRPTGLALRRVGWVRVRVTYSGITS